MTLFSAVPFPPLPKFTNQAVLGSDCTLDEDQNWPGMVQAHVATVQPGTPPCANGGAVIAGGSTLRL